MYDKTHSGSMLGIVGGLGPLASAEFIKTIYECNRGRIEQEAPSVMLYSDPTFPDRTEALLTCSSQMQLTLLVEALEKLRSIGATKIVVCCITLHYLLPRLPSHLQTSVISLLDLIFDQLFLSRRRHLMLCTTGARKAEIFQNHSRWNGAKEWIVFPDEEDQQLIHDFIYQHIKRGYTIDAGEELLTSLLQKYQVTAFIVGCTEIHLLVKHFFLSQANQASYSCIDPLHFLAKKLAEGTL